MKYIILLFFTCSFINLKAQNILTVPQVPQLIYGPNYGGRLNYILTSDIVWKTQALNYNNPLKWSTYAVNATLKAYIADEKNLLVPVDDILDRSVDEIVNLLKGKEFILNRRDSVQLQTIKMISPQLFLKIYYRLETVYQDNKIKYQLWQIQGVLPLATSLVQFGNKTIIDGKEFSLVPTNKGLFTTNGVKSYLLDTVEFNDAEIEYHGKKLLLNKEAQLIKISKQLTSSGYGKVVLNKLGKYEYQNDIGLNILPLTYDEITVFSDFIIAKNNQKYTVYNLFLEELANDVRAYNDLPYLSTLQVIKGNNIKYLGVVPDRKIPNMNIGWGCGTVNSYAYSIKKNADQYLVNVINAGRGNYPAAYKGVNYPVIGNFDKLTFLDGKSTNSFTDNDGLDAEFYLSRKWLISKKDNKYGIVQFNYYDKPKFTPLILPCVYDSVVVDEKNNNPIKLYRNGLVSFFPLGIEKNSIDEITDFKPYLSNEYAITDKRYNYFVRFTKKDGTQGWLDLFKNKEVIDEK